MSAVHNRWELVDPLLLAFPLRSVEHFVASTTEVTRADTLRELRREHHLEDAAVARGLQLIDGSGRPDQRESLHQVVVGASSRWLVASGDHWSLRVEPRHPGHEIIRWRGVTMLMPPSIVVAAAVSRSLGGPSAVRTLPNSIAPMESVAHLHVHLGPMLPFEAIWSGLWTAFLRDGTLERGSNGGIGAIPDADLPRLALCETFQGHGRRRAELWRHALEITFAAKLWLLSGQPSSAAPEMVRNLGRGSIDLLRRASGLLSLWSLPEWRDPARRISARFGRERALRDRDVQKRRCQGRDRAEDVRRIDPARDDVDFMAACFRRCRGVEAAGQDAALAQIFYQYLRVKVALYSTMVVDPWTTGLRHFLDVVQRDKPYVDAVGDRGLDEVRLDYAHREQPLRIKRLEVHVAPTSWLKLPAELTEPGHGWILSFVRAHKPPAGRDHDGSESAKTMRRVRNRVESECRLMERIVTARPWLLRELRGLSLMSWERNGPVWLFERALRRLRAASADIAARNTGLRVRPFQMALHLGEDFDHVISGLRQIYEPFEWGLIGRDDRIGHALALGLSASEWCSRYPWIRMRPWDRILDMGFAYWAFERLKLELDVGVVERMRASAKEAVLAVFGDLALDPLDVARDLWLALPSQGPAEAATASDGVRMRASRGRRDSLLDDPSVGRRALSPTMNVETSLDLPLATALHRVVHERVAAMHVLIEVNPSSNLLIGGFHRIFDQPVFQEVELPITLSTDDPLTFGTTLADEYAYAWAAMVLGGNVTPHEATERLEQAARNSTRYAFD